MTQLSSQVRFSCSVAQNTVKSFSAFVTLNSIIFHQWPKVSSDSSAFLHPDPYVYGLYICRYTPHPAHPKGCFSQPTIMFTFQSLVKMPHSMRCFLMVQFIFAKMFSLGLIVLCINFLLNQSSGILSPQQQYLFQYETHLDQLSGPFFAYRLCLHEVNNANRFYFITPCTSLVFENKTQTSLHLVCKNDTTMWHCLRRFML